VEQLALLTLAIVLALVGFALHFLWFAAVVVLALLWGYQASMLRGARDGGGVASAIVTSSVDEARGLAGDASTTRADTAVDAAEPEDAEPEDAEPGDAKRDAAESGDSGRGDSGSAAPSDEPTKKDLYEKAREADIPGRSTMTKDELQQALDE